MHERTSDLRIRLGVKEEELQTSKELYDKVCVQHGELKGEFAHTRTELALVRACTCAHTCVFVLYVH